MAERRRIALLGLAAVSLVLATGSGAFSATSADRGVSVTVADDANAYLAFPDKELRCGNPQGPPQKNTIVRNQLGTPLDVTVSVSVSGGELRIGDEPGQLEQLGPGEETTLTYRLDPSEAATVQIKPPRQSGNETVDAAGTVHVETVAVGNGIRISVTEREFETTCPVGDRAAS